MRLQPDGSLALSPSDLSEYLACPHLTTLSLAAERGEVQRARLDSPHRELIFRTPALLDADCKTIQQMRLVNAVCRSVELANLVAPSRSRTGRSWR